jgi:hypothetical protein
MNGYGEMYWTDGKVYKGFFEGDKRKGFGVFVWNIRNKVYIGYWEDNKQHGAGKLMLKDNIKYLHWEKGNRVLYYRNQNDAEQVCVTNSHIELFKMEIGKLFTLLNL